MCQKHKPRHSLHVKVSSRERLAKDRRTAWRSFVTALNADGRKGSKYTSEYVPAYTNFKDIDFNSVCMIVISINKIAPNGCFSRV